MFDPMNHKEPIDCMKLKNWSHVESNMHLMICTKFVG